MARMSRRDFPATRPSLVERIDLWFSKGHLVDGIWVGSFTSDAKPANQRIEDALRLIERCAPLHCRRVKNNLARIWVNLVPHGAGYYLHSLNACVLDERIVASETKRSNGLHPPLSTRQPMQGLRSGVFATTKPSANGSNGFVLEENWTLLDIC